ncbi:cytochrome c oxidase subunit 3 [Rubrivivax gelatinosus]|uniref:cytochrome c oxidase subunit 3 n=1 Tax=Rubrivivax gelatinosus TaxID=28068 RepID=UPI000306FDBC|nr:cytochrome c oxidase subunit 3 [Rubrivivax gelatinosus]MBG6082164.1 nitric oxide reductase NorE protein [Rubrivivax gelatinosus]
MQLQAVLPPAAETASDEPDAPDGPRLLGDLAVWLVIAAELLTFGLLFVSYAFARLQDPAQFNALQATLDLERGALNTVLLVSGSAAVAHAVAAFERGRTVAARRWLLAALGCGLGFTVLKSAEIAAKVAAGADLSAETFWMFYLLLSGFHLLHVVAAAVFLAIVWWLAGRGAYGPGRTHVPETAAAFWHMVDLLWIVLFPLLYVMR